MEGGFSGVIYFLLNCMYCKVCFGRIMYKKYIYIMDFFCSVRGADVTL